MNDPDIIELYFERSEEAIAATREKFGAYFASVARRILRDPRDAEEAASDALLAAWDSIPPNKPSDLKSYLGRLCRNAAIDISRRNSREKRGGGEAEAALFELSLLASPDSPEREAESREFTAELNGFLEGLPPKMRRLFVQRYWYLMSTREIARDNTMTEAAVKMQLSRTRAELKAFLIRKGMFYE